MEFSVGFVVDMNSIDVKVMKINFLENMYAAVAIAAFFLFALHLLLPQLLDGLTLNDEMKSTRSLCFFYILFEIGYGNTPMIFFATATAIDVVISQKKATATSETLFDFRLLKYSIKVSEISLLSV